MRRTSDARQGLVGPARVDEDHEEQHAPAEQGGHPARGQCRAHRRIVEVKEADKPPPTAKSAESALRSRSARLCSHAAGSHTLVRSQRAGTAAEQEPTPPRPRATRDATTTTTCSYSLQSTSSRSPTPSRPSRSAFRAPLDAVVGRSRRRERALVEEVVALLERIHRDAVQLDDGLQDEHRDIISTVLHEESPEREEERECVDARSSGRA